MKGCNTLLLNEATIIEAVQEYLNKRTTGIKIVVQSVTSESNGYDRAFKVKTSESAEVAAS